MSIVDLRSDNSNAVQVAFDAKNKVHVQNFKSGRTIFGAVGSAHNPSVIAQFPEVLIQANKGFTLDTYIKAYIASSDDITTTSGMSVATNVKINGTWYSLGSSGRVFCANRGTAGTGAYVSKKYIDFGNLLNRGYVQSNIAYTLQVELAGVCDADAQILVNYDVSEGATLPTGNTGVASVVDQNYTTVIIEETN